MVIKCNTFVICPRFSRLKVHDCYYKKNFSNYDSFSSMSFSLKAADYFFDMFKIMRFYL